MSEFIRNKISLACEDLQRMADKVILPIEEMKMCESDYKKTGEMPKPEDFNHVLRRDQRVDGSDKHFWFYFKLSTPKIKDGKELRLRFTTGFEGDWDACNPQALIYLNGEAIQGIDVNHRDVWLEQEKEYDILVYFYVGIIDPETKNDCETKFNAELHEIDLAVESLYYDMHVPYEAAVCLDEYDYNSILTFKYLEQACNMLDFRNPDSEEFHRSVDEAAKFLKDEFYEKECGDSRVTTSYVGHTHIDVAWKWTVAQTREKAQRSFATVLRLMEKYPEYIFMSSQPQLYQYVKEEQPELYEKIKQKVKDGSWEVDGAMWLEADCNLCSGESIVRQILYGKRFIKDEFGVDSRILWLPDVFGYSAALPQILKKSGVDKFVTSKIGWSETNPMPYDVFMWEGIDGTEIFTYFLTAMDHERYKAGERMSTYVGSVTPQMHLGTWDRFQQKEYNDEVIVTFGYGDGGGGPTAEMIESSRRLNRGLPGMPKGEMTTAGRFLEKVEENFTANCKKLRHTPKWVGELYLELHRGTYTSMAKNKRYNRECEFLCQGTETLGVMNNILFGTEYPQDMFHENWTRLLLNQFHDIIPGSSIKEVYVDSDRDYAKVYEQVGTANSNYIKKLADSVCEAGILVYNPNSFVSSDYVACGGDLIYAKDIPAFGWKVVKPQAADEAVKVFDKCIDSPIYCVKFDDDMNIISIYDKENNREVVAKGKKLNQLRVFEDRPKNWDNWEITSYYRFKAWDVNDVQSVETVKRNGAAGFKITRKYMNSTIEQTILIYENSRRIDVMTEADWHENHVLLKAMFPSEVHATKASYDIQFGNLERTNNENTSWDKAKFEVCAHKWGDLSEENYGISILNNCKYGYSAIGNEMTLTLIKCGTFPNTEADQGYHKFTYSIYPHAESFKKGGTIKESYKLNRPMQAVKTNGTGILPSSYSLISCDCENIIIETVKQAESGKGIIVRMYDAWNKKSKPILTLGFDAKKIFICDMLENPIEKIGKGNTVQLDMSNFEIVTLLIEHS